MAKIKVYGSLHRWEPGSGPQAFRACVRVGRDGGGELRAKGKGYSKTFQCAYGKNPRKALASALHKAAKHIDARRGRFAGHHR